MLVEEDCVLVVIDVQEILMSVIAEKKKVIDNVVRLLKFSQIIDLPVVLTEQERLGPTVSEVKEEIPDCTPISKITTKDNVKTGDTYSKIENVVNEENSDKIFREYSENRNSEPNEMGSEQVYSTWSESKKSPSREIQERQSNEATEKKSLIQRIFSWFSGIFG